MSHFAATAARPAPIKAGMGSLTERLRAAIRSEAYDDVLGLLAEYNRRFEQSLRDASGDLAETKRVASEARELFDWARTTVSASRAHTEAGLHRMNHASRYGTARNASARTWQLEA